MTPVWRIRDRTTFLELRRHGRRARRGPVTVTWLETRADDVPRVAYAVARRVGGAVVRNRLRRRLRAIVQELRVELRPGAYLVGASADANGLPFDTLREYVRAAVRGVHEAAA